MANFLPTFPEEAWERQPDPVVRTDGAWWPDEAPLYFLASNVARLRQGVFPEATRGMLFSAHEVNIEKDLPLFDAWRTQARGGLIDPRPRNILMDSGIFVLSGRQAKLTGSDADLVRRLPPSKIVGFEEHWRKYLSVIKATRHLLWGYVEIDYGDYRQKIATRRILEEEHGLRPIPTFHVGVDPWDYFGYLCTRYDRVMISMRGLHRLPNGGVLALGLVWEYMQHYPKTWVHLLGITPTAAQHGYPVHSMDSASWLMLMRCDSYRPRLDQASFGALTPSWWYDHRNGRDPRRGDRAGAAFGAWSAGMTERTWKAHAADTARLRSWLAAQ